MKRQNETSLSDMLKIFARQPKISNKLKRFQIEEAWRDLMGPVIAQYTSSIYLHKNKLTISISSSSLRQELFMNKDKIKEQINAYLTDDLIETVVIR